MEQGGTKKSLIMFGLGIAFLLGGIDITAFNLALVWIQRDLSLTLVATDWVINSYLIAFGSFIVPAGRIADIYGHKLLYLIGLAIFTLMSFLGGFAETGRHLIWARTIQGIGTACFWPCIVAITMHLFPSRTVSKALGFLMCLTGIGFAGGPLLSGFLLEYLSWRYVLWINIPIALLAFFLGVAFLPKKTDDQEQKRLDFVSLIFLICFCFSLINAIGLAGTLGFDNKRVLGWFAASMGILWLFVVRQENTKSPLIEIPLLKHDAFIMGVIFRMFMQFAFFGVIFFIGYALQQILMVNPIKAGLYFLPYTISFALFSILGGLLTNRYGMQRLMYIGMWSLAIGMILFGIIIRYSFDFWMIFLPLVISGFGMGIFLPNNNFFAVSPLPKNYWGVGTAILYMGVLISASVAVVIASSFMHNPGTRIALQLLHEKNIPLNNMKILLIESVMKGMKTIPDLLLEFQSDKVVVYEAIKTAFIQAMSIESFIAAALILIPMIIYQLYQKYNPKGV